MDLFKSISLIFVTIYFLSLIDVSKAKHQPVQSSIKIDENGHVRGLKAEGIFMPKNFNKADIGDLLKDPNVKNLPGFKSQLKNMVSDKKHKSSKKRRSKNTTKRRTLEGTFKESMVPRYQEE